MPSTLDRTFQEGRRQVNPADLSPPAANAPQPKTFVPPVGLNQEKSGRPPTSSGRGVGRIQAPPQIAQLTNPQALMQSVGQGGAVGQGAPLPPGTPALLPFLPDPGALSFDPIAGVWHMPDGRVVPGGSGSR